MQATGYSPRLAPVGSQIHPTFRGAHRRFERHIEGSYRNSGIVAYEVKKLREELNLPESSGANAISAALVKTLGNEPIDAAKLDARYVEVDKEEGRAANQVERQRLFSRNKEIWIVVFGTLQWGFGDLLLGCVSNGVH